MIFRRNRKPRERRRMGVVLPLNLIESSIRVRELVNELQRDSTELKRLIQQERGGTAQ